MTGVTEVRGGEGNAWASMTMRPWMIIAHPHPISACHVFVRLTLNAWPTHARMNPPEGVRGCLLGCAGSVDDLCRYVQSERLWLPTFRAVRMSASPSWARHGALEGDALQPCALGWRPSALT